MNSKDKKKLFKIVITTILYIISIIFNKLKIGSNFYLSDILFLISYLLVGFEILKKAFRNITRGKVFDENFLMSVATIRSFCYF